MRPYLLMFLLLQMILQSIVVLAYNVIFEQNFGTQTTGCSANTTFFWENESGNKVTSCDTSCSFDSNSALASTLRILDNSYTFKFTISETFYSTIGVDITFISSDPQIKLTLLSDAPMTTSSTPSLPELFEKGSLTCSPIIGGGLPTKLINAEIRSNNINIAQNQGTLVIKKVSGAQIIGIRSLRLWVNCSENCLTCASPIYCSVCIEGFDRHTAIVNSIEVTACEVIENCPANCAQCYTIAGATTCKRCEAGFQLISNACIAYIPNSPCWANSYPNSSGNCVMYTNNAFYFPRGSSVPTSFTQVDRMKYRCADEVTVVVKDYYNFKLYHCGCVNKACKECYSLNTCLACKDGYYRDSWSQYCRSCTYTSCNNCLANGTGCTACKPGYVFDAHNVCESNCNASLNCEVCSSYAGPCTKCKQGFKFNGGGICVAFTCSTNEVLDQATNTCVCLPGFTLSGMGNCEAQVVVPSCPLTQYVDTSNNTCVCPPGFMMDQMLSCVLIPVCLDPNEVLNALTAICDCVAGYLHDAFGVCVIDNQQVPCLANQERNQLGFCVDKQTNPSTGGGNGGGSVVLVEIREMKEDKGFMIVVDCKVKLSMYAGQDIQNVMSLSIDSGVKEYSYSIQKIEGTQVWILLEPKVTFKGEKANVHFIDSTFIQLNKLSSQEYSVELSYYIELEEWQKQANVTTSSVAEVTVVAILTTIIPIAIFSNFYVLINTIDLTAFLYYLLFIDVRYPSNVLAFYGFFQNFQFPFIPDLFLNIISQDYTQEAAKPFKENATQRYFLSNSGQSISIVIYILAIYVVGKLFSYVSIPKLQDYLKRAMYETWEYSAFFDLVWSLYIYFLIGALLQFQTYDFEEENYILNYTLHSFFGAIMILAPFGVSMLLYMKKNIKSDTIFKTKFGTLLGGLVLYDENADDNSMKEQERNSDNKSEKESVKEHVEESKPNDSEQNIPSQWRIKLTKMYMGVLYFRKLAFSIILVFMTDFTYIQLSLFSTLNVLMLAYFYFIKPLEDKWENIKNAVGEVVLIIVQICAAILVEDSQEDDEDRRYNIGWIIIGFSGFIMAWHTIQLVLEMLKSLYQSIKNLICRKKDSTKVHVFSQEDIPLQNEKNKDSTSDSHELSSNEVSAQPSYVSSNASTLRSNERSESSKVTPPRRRRRLELMSIVKSSNAS